MNVAVLPVMPMDVHVDCTVSVPVNVGVLAMADGLLQTPSEVDRAKGNQKPASHCLARRIYMRRTGKGQSKRGTRCAQHDRAEYVAQPAGQGDANHPRAGPTLRTAHDHERSVVVRPEKGVNYAEGAGSPEKKNQLGIHGFCARDPAIQERTGGREVNLERALQMEAASAPETNKTEAIFNQVKIPLV